MVPVWRRIGAIVFALALIGAFSVAGIVVRPPAARADEDGAHVEAQDDYFQQEFVRIPVGATVDWENTGRNPHNVIADDGSFTSQTLTPGSGTFSVTFDHPGAFRYYCSFHGAKGGVGMSGIVVVGDATVPGSASGVGPGREQPPTQPGPTIRVPQDRPTIQQAVDVAEPGSLVLVSPGVYHEAVLVTKPFLTIRGTDRNRVILDGEFRMPNGIHVVEADGVAVENMTARHYLANGFYWSSVFGYRGSYLTAYDDGDYGIYSFDSRYGQFDHSYASGHPDSGFYIGQCQPCDAVISDVLAEHNALGYSGTNAGGNLEIVNSEWRDNMAGIVPNTLDSEKLAPQRNVLIAGNYVHDNNDEGAPAKFDEYAAFGIGIVVAGGRQDTVVNNLVEDHRTYGIAVLPNLDQRLWTTDRVVVRDNVVRRSGRADLALGAPAGEHDCFSGNDVHTSIPPAVELFYGCGAKLGAIGGGDLAPTIGSLVRFLQGDSGHYPHGDWRDQPAPPPQPRMPDAIDAPPYPAIPETAVPQPIHIRDARTLRTRDDGHDVSQEVTIMGIPIATSWWGLLIGVYGYLLPLVLYAAWVSISLWDLLRQDTLPNRRRIGWMAAILLIPFLGPVAYFAFGRSPIPRSLRLMLVAGGLGVYILFAIIGALAAG
jgi:plastocyanin